MNAKLSPHELITGVVLAGGRGQRMGGVDKGLQVFRGKPLVQHALQGLSSQVSTVWINANRHQSDYAQWGHRVFSDGDESFAGPLSGMLAAMSHCQTPWLMSVPCDAPLMPVDLVSRLFEAAHASGADLALPSTVRETGQVQWQTVFLLARTELRDSLKAYLERGERKIETWIRSQNHVVLPFDDDACFANINTHDELRSLESP